MSKVYLSQFKFNEYKGAENINVRFGYTPETPYLEDYSVVDSNGFYLSQDEPNEFNYTLSTEYAGDTAIYLNRNMSGICKDLTNLYHTDIMNKTKLNYHYTTNLHTAFANCYRLFEQPISAKYVNSMYGTYYNGTNLYGPAAINANVTNMIGTYYNCDNIITSNTSAKTTVMVDAFYNCSNITGRPYCGNNVKSLYNAYYNCLNLQGAPANCNNVAIAINSYYNCPNLYGTFYWYKKDTPFADAINATNMFYNRNCSSWLNIYVYPNKCVFNALVNYSDTFGNLYGTGALTWSKVTGLYGFNNYENSLYKTRIVEYFRPINIRGYIFNNYIVNSSTRYDYETYYKCNIFLYNGVYNSVADLPKETYSTQSFYAQLNASYGINIWVRWKNYYVINRESSRYYYRYNLNIAYYYIIINNQDPDTICWLDCPSLRTINDFDYASYFNMDTFLTNLYRIYDPFSFKNNQIVIAKCGNKVTDMCYTYYFNLSGYAYPYQNGKELPWWVYQNLTNERSNFYHALPIDEWTQQDITVPTNVSIRPACGENVLNMTWTYQNWNIDTEPVCGSNVINMWHTYQNCRKITEPACGDNVKIFVETYYNTDLKNPYFGPNVINSYRAYGYTNTTAKNVKLPNTIPNTQYTYRNCYDLTNIENLNFYGIQNIAGCFLGCSNLTIEEDTNILYSPTFTTISHLFYNCYNINYTMPLPSDMFAINNMSHSYMGCSKLKDLRDKNFTANNFNSTFAYCSNLTINSNKIYFTNNTYDINYLFAECIRLAEDINWTLPQNHYMNMEGCFYDCSNINYINIQQSEYGCMIGGGMFYYCRNLKNVNFYPSVNDGEIYVNFDHLFCDCSNLEYIIGVKNFNGARSIPPVASGDTSREINFEQDYSTNNNFALRSGQGGYLFYDCYNLKYVPNFVGGGYIGPNSFGYCHNITSLNFWAGDGLSWTTYTFLNSSQIHSCSKLQTVVFNQVRYWNFNHCSESFYYLNNLSNIYVYNYTHLNLNFTYCGSILDMCDNIQYFLNCNFFNHQYRYGEAESDVEEYQDLFPVRCFFNNIAPYSYLQYSFIRDCNNVIDIANCFYLFNIRHFYSIDLNNSYFRYCNNLRGLIINSNYLPNSIFKENINLMNLNYIHLEEDETLGYSNWSYASTMGGAYNYFNRNTITQLDLNYFYLGVFNRWTGTYLNYDSNYDARNNKRSGWSLLWVNNIFKNTSYKKLNIFVFDDKIDTGLLYNTHSYFNGAMKFRTLAVRNHLFNQIFNYTLKGITNINSLILSSHYLNLSTGRAGNQSFEITNIINSRIADSMDSPYTKLNNNFLPLEKIHCNYIYIGFNMNTFIPKGDNFNRNYLKPTVYESAYDFADVITNSSSVQDVSLIFGTELRDRRIDQLYPDEFTHQTKLMGIAPSKILLNYSGTEYSIYTKGTLGAHIAYLGASHPYTQYFGTLSYTENRTLIAQYDVHKNIFQYSTSDLNIIRTNNFVNKFYFYPGESLSINNFFTTIYSSWDNATVLSTVGPKNYTINLYEVDLANSARNIHIKYILEELNFLD